MSHLIANDKKYAGVYHRLTLDGVVVVLNGNVDLGKDLNIGLPFNLGTRLSAGVDLFMQSADIFTVFKVQFVEEAIAAYFNVHICRRILRCAQAQAVESKRVLVVLARIVIILTARVELAKDQLPVILVGLGIKVDRNTPSKVLDLDRVVRISGNDDLVSEALTRFVNGVGYDLKNRVLATVNTV